MTFARRGGVVGKVAPEEGADALQGFVSDHEQSPRDLAAAAQPAGPLEAFDPGLGAGGIDPGEFRRPVEIADRAEGQQEAREFRVQAGRWRTAGAGC